VAEYGTRVEEIFASYEELRDRFGAELAELPLGAVGVYTFCQKLRVGLQQLMAGSRNFQLRSISRRDLMALTQEATQVTGIPYVMDAYREEAEAILDDVGSYEATLVTRSRWATRRRSCAAAR